MNLSRLRPPRAWLLLLLGTACASTPPAPDQGTPAPPAVGQAPASDEAVLAEDVRIRRIAPGVWLHVTLAGEEWGRAPSNGLLVEEGDSTLLVDTAWNARQTELLLVWAKDTLHRPVRAAVVTHSHADRTGGMSALVARGVPVHASEDTARLTAGHGRPAPDRRLPETGRLGPLEVFFPGAGHSRDNLVVWLPAQRLLFGGCFVKDEGARNLGNVADADVAAWPASLERLRQRFPDVREVVPGHGEPGGPSLLTHTLALLRDAPPG
ncbi:Beta-lactamase [Cystobacter fuscus DSM 2262]|uniref:beta-lactamase n=1 Tax=Cystobacter fuscus (strain ATCC 25194 / DSM 2262 / NBRC 100088 / M29) TaxID=1242864 RepID=S9P0M2_CYSF2|nr:subclass B1 metallo-beta-lactamase [Cystobacter fuscus]EPX56631.1 Beta-lactamase [Cystobacter fuscus DSM 2262]